VNLAETGKLQLSIAWDGTVVRQVDIVSSRSPAFLLLNGQTPERAVQMARLLFNVCGNAQGTAATAAVAAAQGLALEDRSRLELGIACEAMQEHLWRLLQDWPALLEQPMAQADFVRWYRLLRDIVAGKGKIATLRTELETRWLGSAVDEWLTLRSLDELQTWCQFTDSPAARLLAMMDTVDATGSDPGIPVLPDWTAGQAATTCGDALDVAFAMRPHLRGIAAETGALGYYAQTPLLQDVLQQRPSRLLARMLARLYDMLDMVLEGYDRRLDSAQTPDGAGLALVRTARGLLLHRVRVAAGQVRDYVTVAPTEWNFHPCGALVAGLEGVAVEDRNRLERLVRWQVLSLDPCVEYTMEISRA